MNRKGFTLVEILIVVIILGILAAVVIPQFTQASNDARDSALVSDLQTVRSQLELYKVQHLEKYPNLDESGAADTDNFVARMTGKTDADATINAAGLLGPYLQKFPKNPWVPDANADKVEFSNVDPVASTDYGWHFNIASGKFSAHDAAHLTK